MTPKAELAARTHLINRCRWVSPQAETGLAGVSCGSIVNAVRARGCVSMFNMLFRVFTTQFAP